MEVFFLFDKASKYENFRVYGLADTHEKVLIVDDSDAIITSYNWLSRYGSKKERGVHFTNPMLVQNEKARCMTEFVDSRLMRSYTGIPEKVENYGSHCVLRLKGCPLPILVAGLPLERMAWLQQRIDEKAQLEVLCGSPTNNNLLFLAARKIGG